ncbi:hypothetical protein [Ligilactobacillus faecis]|uniref:hypothetical protein n=1 Tax=Ligilactobacillus faecis TaxID=762833 RepID=UPI002469263E|nr:hypothetical protein [Ligilactobacillus faecis]WGN89764.1 hypothetical protein QFX10_01445 [Ligilactobacillus faecis]
MKLESGDKATDWSPAPEDTANQLLNVGNTLKTYQTELNVLKDGMTFRTSEIARVNDRIDKLGIQNLVYNSEFSNNAEGWTNIGNNSAGTIFFSNNEWDSWQGSNGLAFRNSSAPTSTLLSQSKRFKVLNWQRISASVQLHVTDTITNSCDAGIEIIFYPDETSGNEIKRVSQTTSRVNNISNGFAKLLYVNDVEVPSNAKFATLRLWTYKVGNVIFNQPMVTFSSSYLPYTQDNKSLGVLSEKYAALDVKVNGINSVVANKADISYVDQRAGQWQAKLEELQVGGTNLLYNTREYQGWDLYNCSVEDDNGAKTRIIHYWFGAGQQNAKDSAFRAKNSIYLVKGQQYTISCKAKYYSSNPTGREVGGQSLHMFSSYTDQHGGGGFLLTETLRDQWKKYSCTFTSDRTGSFDGWRIINWINGSFEGGSIYVAEIKIEEGSRATDWSPAPEDNMAAITAVRNELNTAIDLRVQKGELLSQINMQAGHTLIQANKIYLDSESVVFSGKAFIPSAAIASLSADKINGGTINGRNINVINLNANNITSGSISGSNLNINLDSGYVSFQKGRIRSTTGTLDIDIDNGTLNIVDIWGNGVFARNGSIDFSRKSIWDKNKDPQYGRINRSSTILNEACDGMEIIGNEGIVMKSNNYNGWGYLLSDKINGAGVTLGKSGKMLLEASGPMTLMSGTLSDGIVRSRPQIKIGTNGWLDHGNLDSSGNNIYMIANGVCINANGETLIGTGGLTVKGRLGVEGSKNSIVDTSQGKTAINAYETAEYYFGDIAKANTGTFKRIKILIDPLFLETINTSIDYHVFVSSYGDGYAWVSEMKGDYFVIESNVPNLPVSYEIKAKRKQYENVRLDKVDVDLKGENK